MAAKTPSHPNYAVMATAAVKNIKSFSKGASRPAIKSFIKTNYSVEASAAALRSALAKLVKAGSMTQEGQRFKLSSAARVEAGKKPKAKKTKAKASAKKTSAKKTSTKKTSAKKTSAKKSSKKTSAKKTSAKKISAKKAAPKKKRAPKKAAAPAVAAPTSA